MSCEHCQYKGAVDLFNDDGDKVVTICGHNFCPMCGTPLDEPEPLTLEQPDREKCEINQFAESCEDCKFCARKSAEKD